MSVLNDNSKMNDPFKTIHDAAKILSEHAGQKEILKEVLNVLEKNLRMLRGTIMLVSPDGNELGLEAVHDGVTISPEEACYHKGEGVLGLVLEKGESVVIHDIAIEPRFKDRIHKRKQKIPQRLSFICVPIKIGQEVVGTLSVDMEYSPFEILKNYSKILEIIACLISADIKSRRIRRMEKKMLENENLRLHEVLNDQLRPEHIIGNSKFMREVYTKILQVKSSDTTVLILGESGTGKELIANAIHYSSPFSKGPLIKVNCAALNSNLFESELFGHEKGAFTGALKARIGRLEEAFGGTLFLDEIGDFPMDLQVKLLRVFQEKEFQRVGSNHSLKANVRFIAATNKNLNQAVKEGSFRQDLFYRIQIFPIQLPPLRERKEDILLMADHFVKKYADKMKKLVRRISTSAIEMLMSYHWPGNVRELENCIEYAVLVSMDNAIHAHNLPPTLQMPENPGEKNGFGLKQQIKVMEKDLIIDALKSTKGNVSAAGRELGLNEKVMRYKINNLKIDMRSFFTK